MNISDQLGPKPTKPRDLRVYRVSAALLGTRLGLRPAEVARQIGDRPHLAYGARTTLDAILELPDARRRLESAPPNNLIPVVAALYDGEFIGRADEARHRPRKAKSKEKCLGCGRGFLSEGPHNRLCPTCGGRAASDPTGGDYSLAV